MTAIAYARGIMAADTATFSVNVRTSFRSKLVRAPSGEVVGCCGVTAICEEYRRWIADGHNWRTWRFSSLKEDDFGAIVALPDGTVWEVTPSGYCAIGPEFAASGSPYEFLYGALAAGASAEQAVELAIKHTRGAGGTVETMRVGPG